jgi:hypothetical protein
LQEADSASTDSVVQSVMLVIFMSVILLCQAAIEVKRTLVR